MITFVGARALAESKFKKKAGCTNCLTRIRLCQMNKSLRNYFWRSFQGFRDRMNGELVCRHSRNAMVLAWRTWLGA